MNKLILALLIVLPVTSFSQKIFYGKVVVGNYWMADMKKLQKEYREEFIEEGIPAEIVLSFPVSIQGEFGVDFAIYDALLKEYLVGGFINYSLTSGVINYSDYSGRVDLEQEFKRLSLGIKGATDIRKDLQVYAKISYHMTYLDFFKRTTLTGAEPVEDEVRLEPEGISCEPGLQWTKAVDRFRFSVHGGYEFSMITSQGNYLTNDKDDPVYPGWSGFRLGAGVGFAL